MDRLVESPSAQRLGWVDTARGMSILLVVLLHTQGALTAIGLDHPALDSLNVALATVRMPTFFLVSGLFARSVLDAPLGEFVRRRPAHFGYLYVLWSAIFVGVAAVLAIPDAAAAAHAAGDGLREALVADGVLWYFVALALYFVVARLTRAVPVPVQLAAAAVLFVLSALRIVQTGSWGPDHMLNNYLFFLVGVHLRGTVTGYAGRAGWRRWALLLTGWIVLGAGLRILDPSGRLLLTVLPLIGVPMMLDLAVLLAGRARWVGVVGRTTLPVYVLHPLVLAVGAAALAGVSLDGVPLPVQFAVVLVATVVVAGLTWLAWTGLRRVDWLFALPHRRREPGRRTAASAADPS